MSGFVGSLSPVIPSHSGCERLRGLCQGNSACVWVRETFRYQLESYQQLRGKQMILQMDKAGLLSSAGCTRKWNEKQFSDCWGLEGIVCEKLPK